MKAEQAVAFEIHSHCLGLWDADTGVSIQRENTKAFKIHSSANQLFEPKPFKYCLITKIQLGSQLIYRNIKVVLKELWGEPSRVGLGSEGGRLLR